MTEHIPAFDQREGWYCTCSDFEEREWCKHVQDVAALRTVRQAAKDAGGSDRNQ